MPDTSNIKEIARWNEDAGVPWRDRIGMLIAAVISGFCLIAVLAADHATDKLLALIAAGVLWNLVAHLRTRGLLRRLIAAAEGKG